LDCEINNDNNVFTSIEDEIDRILGTTHEWKRDDDVVSMTGDGISEMFSLTDHEMICTSNEVFYIYKFFFISFLNLNYSLYLLEFKFFVIFFEFKLFFISS